MKKYSKQDMIIGVVGLGYVGLPLALEFGKKYKTIAYDVSKEKISNYIAGCDPSGEVNKKVFSDSKFVKFTIDHSLLKNADFIIVAVPTPVNKTNNPDFSALKNASKVVGRNLKYGCTVIYESTVYPGATEELCMPILEKESGYTWKEGFFLGYSPERINPGDKNHTLTAITKVVSGDSEDTLKKVEYLYGSIIKAGTFSASSIKVAEAAKVIENTQRDLNIALINELSVIFHRLNIDTMEVLEAAGTKWNFLPFRPGLVGGHCIGVDPYYLTHKAQEVGYQPEVILSGRRINDSISNFIVEDTIKEMINLSLPINNGNIIILGITFKENCSDVRNSKVVDLANAYSSYGLNVYIFDPVANPKETFNNYGITLSCWEELPSSSAIVEAVPHTEIRNITIQEISKKLINGAMYIDIKSQADKEEITSLGYKVWRL